MKQFKLLICCALLSTFVLVGCGDDEDDVLTLELGEYTSTRFVATGCTAEEDNEDVVPDCDSEDGCLKLVLNADLSAELLLQDEDNPVPALFLEGTYVIAEENITIDFTGAGAVSVWQGEIVGNTEMIFSQTDEDYGCLETTTYSK